MLFSKPKPNENEFKSLDVGLGRVEDEEDDCIQKLNGKMVSNEDELVDETEEPNVGEIDELKNKSFNKPGEDELDLLTALLNDCCWWC